MKYLVKFFVVTFLFFICTYVQAEDSNSIAYIDLKIVLNESKAGKEAQAFLKKNAKTNVDKFTKLENSLKKKEQDLIAKKNVLNKEEYKKMANNLRKEVSNFQNDRNSALQTIAKQRTTARAQLVDALRPILKDYSKENNISLIINKKDALYIDDSLDLTKPIIKILNKKLPSVNLK